MKETKVTIKDVAKHAGVGIGTVSSVINRSRSVSPQAQRKVEESIRALGYTPDELARSFRTQRTQTIAFFVNDISNHSFSSMAKGMYEELEKHGLHLMLHHTGNKRMEDKILEAVQQKRFDGIVLTLQDERHPQLLEWLKSSPIPIVLLDRELPGIAADVVRSDYYNGIGAATEHLLALGHRRIGLVTTASDILPAKDTIRGYQDALARSGVGSDADMIRRGDFSLEFGMSASAALIESGATAIIAGSNQLLVGSVETVRDLGLDVPRQLSLIGFEDSDVTRLLHPGITVVKRPLVEIGRHMAELLLARLRNDRNKTRTRAERAERTVPTELIVRASCASPIHRT
ncbi:LacI family DNA-binding transcriptional regulator [Paenibacillus cymbidii]|uniref:LacI family DNA-binding transcriptional regulator n=1 Tax=Paenibacillus cymbidii TaxID=1639034 RepID=UPI00143696ED|nr:LacI family DNA-binding transcriptional regulator [Paenibacillus cymbidii]